MSSTACPPGGDNSRARPTGPARLARRTDTAIASLAREERPHRTLPGLRPVPTAAAPHPLWSAAMHTTLHYLNNILAAAPQPVAAPKTLPQVIDGIRVWIMGIIAAVATMFLVVGGLRY